MACSHEVPSPPPNRLVQRTVVATVYMHHVARNGPEILQRGSAKEQPLLHLSMTGLGSPCTWQHRANDQHRPAISSCWVGGVLADLRKVNTPQRVLLSVARRSMLRGFLFLTRCITPS